MRFDFVIVIALVALGSIAVVTRTYFLARECNACGGVLAKTVAGYKCVKVIEVP